VFLFLFSVALAQNTTGVTTTTTMAATSGYASLAPHMRPGAPRRCVKWMGDNPPSLYMYFGGGLRVCMALKALLCSSNDASPQNQSVLRAMHTPTAPKVISACGGVTAYPFGSPKQNKRSRVRCYGAISPSGSYGQPWL
jgi:hypothetical protein